MDGGLIAAALRFRSGRSSLEMICKIISSLRDRASRTAA
jgi:hypothetical protein